MAHTKVTKTYSQNTGAANTFSYSGSFDVFKGTEVECELDNVQLTFTASTINESASPREYTVDTSAKTIHIGGADLSSGTIVIRPVTDMGDPTPRATYAPGSSVTSEDLNNNQTQLMRKAMEYDEQKLSALGGTMTGHLTMGEDQTIIFEGATDDGYETTLTVTDPTADRTITLPNVTGTVVTTGDTGSVATGMIAADAITNAKIADNALDSEHYTDGSIDADHLASSSVTTAKIGSDAVTGAKIADDAIDSEHYTDGSIDTAHIGDSQVTTAKIADTNVTTAKIAADAITAAKIADDVVNSEHIAAGAVDLEHMSANSVDSDQYVDGSIDTAHIADLNVTTAKIAADAITAAKIADDVVNSEHYAAGSIDTEHIADLNVTTAKIAADAITAAKIADDVVDSEHLAAGSIDTEHIAGTQVTAAKIASNAVTTAKITDANVTTVKIADSNVTIAKLASDLKSTSIADSDTQLPTSGAVVDYVAAQLLPFGGFEAIATEVAFPNTQPASGVIISISDAAGVVVNGSGTSTTGRTVGSSTVTINNFPSSLNSETLASGVGLMVSSTGSSQIYNYHKILAAESDVKQLSGDINDFNARYRVNAGEPGSDNDEGDLVYDTSANKMKVYDGSSWGEVTSTGDFKYLVMTNAGTTNAATLNGSNVTFDLKETSTGGSAASVTSAAQLLVSVNGVVQKANTGTSASGLDGFVMADSDTITFCAAPASGDDIFIVQFGSALSSTTPADGTVSAAKITSGAVTTAKIADDAVTAAKIADDAVGAEHIEVLDANLDFADDAKARFGTSDDLEIFHGGGHSKIYNANGNIYISNESGNTSNVVLQATWGEESVIAKHNAEVELYYDNSLKAETTSSGFAITGILSSNQTSGQAISIGDNAQINLGAGDDLKIYHDGSHSYLDDAGTGALKVRSSSFQVLKADGSEYIINTDEDDGVDLYFNGVKKFETDTNGVTITGQCSVTSNIALPDHSSGYVGKMVFGGGDDLEIYHNSSNYIDSNTTLFIRGDASNSIYIRPKNDENAAQFKPNNSVDLFYDGSKKFETTSAGVAVTGTTLTTDNIKITVDNGAFYSGAGDDLKLYHDGSHSHVLNNTGTQYYASAQHHFYDVGYSELQAKFVENAQVELYHNGGAKFETTSSGVTVHGSVNETSDIALKTNIEPIDNVLDKIKQITGYTYQFKDTGHDSIGVTAQDVEKVFPELVHGEEGTKTLQYSGLIGALIESVKELSAKVAALEAK